MTAILRSAFRRIDVGLLKVTFFAAFVLLLETTLFHLLHFIFDYYAAVMVVSFTVLGIGLGAFAASRIALSDRSLFVLCCLGTTAALYLCVFLLGRFPMIWLSMLLTAACFFFPVLYISRVFRDRREDRVYAYDMLGAFLGVLGASLGYRAMRSEDILFCLLFLTPLIGLLYVVRSLADRASQPSRTLLLLSFAFTLSGGVLFVEQLGHDTFNFYDTLRSLSNEESHDLDRFKAFRIHRKYPRVKTYDNLVGRVDVLKVRRRRKRPLYYVVYNGYSNDIIGPSRSLLYRDLAARPRPWLTRDVRVLHGLVSEPRVFIIGAAAEGIVKPLKRITPPEKIVPVEVNPAIVQLMTKDFYGASGRAYEKLEPVVGNAISLLKRSKEKFDIITLINTHSTKTIGFQGAPNYLHTVEQHRTYFDHLTPQGYLLLEERLFNKTGELAFYRLLTSLWRCLEERGAEDPREHIAIWEWMNRRAIRGKFKRYDWDYYMGIIVTRTPLRGDRRERALHWLKGIAESKRLAKRVGYFKGYKERPEFVKLFDRIASSDFRELEQTRDFDPSLPSNDRPFLQVATKSAPRINTIVWSAGIATGVLWLLFSGLLWRQHKKPALLLNTYNVFIGFGYFFVEIVLIQTYQNVFVSATAGVIYVLGFLLLSSGAGGLFSGRIKTWVAMAALIPVLLAALYVPNLLVVAGAAPELVGTAAVTLVILSGFFMGVFFPHGLRWARAHGLEAKIPHLFAINSLAGSFAVVLALLFGVKIGYRGTIIVALGCYLLAVVLKRLGTARGESGAKD